jgi:HD-GYP domain-containing protein (c-di-GMP phosphodiesterase class II)
VLNLTPGLARAPKHALDTEAVPSSEGPAPTLAGALAESGYPNIVLTRLAEQTCQLLSVENSSIQVREDETQATIIVAGHGVDEELIGERRASTWELSDRIACTGARTLRFGSEKAQWWTRDRPTSEPTTLVAPVSWSGGTPGALAAGTSHCTRRFAPAEVQILCQLAKLAGTALSDLQWRSRLRSKVRARVGALAAAIEAHDGYTAYHSEEVVALARRVGRKFGLGPASLFELELAALLHDLGKLRLPKAILHKPGPLDDSETALVRRHPIWGAGLLAATPGLQAVAMIVRFHHERWDGTGYPYTLDGPRIPLASRVIAACDAYHAMTSDRPYRDALSAQEALDQLEANAGSQFDPNVVRTLAQLLRSRDKASAPTLDPIQTLEATA